MMPPAFPYHVIEEMYADTERWTLNGDLFLRQLGGLAKGTEVTKVLNRLRAVVSYDKLIFYPFPHGKYLGVSYEVLGPTLLLGIHDPDLDVLMFNKVLPVPVAAAPEVQDGIEDVDDDEEEPDDDDGGP